MLQKLHSKFIVLQAQIRVALSSLVGRCYRSDGLRTLHSKLIVAQNFELVAQFWGWYVLLRASGARGRLSCYWDHDQDCLGYYAPHRLWEVAADIKSLEKQMQKRGCPLAAIPLELWREDTRPDAEVKRLAKVLSQHSEPMTEPASVQELSQDIRIRS
jgi:hypothetical protein